jgi:hypothetical protein
MKYGPLVSEQEANDIERLQQETVVIKGKAVPVTGHEGPQGCETTAETSPPLVISFPLVCS